MSKYTERTARNRLQAIRIMGGKCQMCGWKAESQLDLMKFEFHHIIGNKGSEQPRDVVKKVLNGNFENYLLLDAGCHKIANLIDGTSLGSWTTSIKEDISDLLA